MDLPARRSLVGELTGIQSPAIDRLLPRAYRRSFPKRIFPRVWIDISVPAPPSGNRSRLGGRFRRVTNLYENPPTSSPNLGPNLVRIESGFANGLRLSRQYGSGDGDVSCDRRLHVRARAPASVRNILCPQLS